mmetsp:Transcript_8020/g.14054  ORF Transcript_8020/g.14054 Transcript_8020/m.14054 type:complete len:93 (+) Transcript_8020:1000-1278(+)
MCGNQQFTETPGDGNSLEPPIESPNGATGGNDEHGNQQTTEAPDEENSKKSESNNEVNGNDDSGLSGSANTRAWMKFYFALALLVLFASDNA